MFQKVLYYSGFIFSCYAFVFILWQNQAYKFQRFKFHAFFICHPNFCVLFCSGELLQSVSFRNFITQPYVAGNRVVLLRVFSAFHFLGSASAPALFMLFPTRKKPKDVL